MPTDDYIKKADAVFAVQKRIEQIGMGNNPHVCSIRQAVRDVPAADVEPVVRCRDCKYKPTAPAGITHGLQVEFPDQWFNRCPCRCEDGWY